VLFRSHEQTFAFFTALLARVPVLVLGVRAVTDEFRHGTIVSTLVVTPSRGRVVAAKAVTVAVAGALVTLTAWGAMVASATVLASTEGTSLRLGEEAWRSLGGTALAGAAWGLIGLGLGAIVRSQVAAIVGGLVWLMGLEDAVRDWFGDAAAYLPGQAGLALALGSSGRALAVGAATMGAYAAVATIAGAAAMRRDVT
jgi:ABC-2 type transport system permease protein